MLIKNNFINIKNKNKIDLFDYDRSKLFPKWLHIGSGNFHKSHQAYYLNNLLKKGKSNWSIIDYDLLNIKNNLNRNLKLLKQDCLYTLITKNFDKTINYSLIGSITNYFTSSSNNLKKILNLIYNKKINLISLTVTENGYYFINNSFDINNKLIKNDIKKNKKINTIYGFLFLILKVLIESNHRITVMSCDNILNNSDTLKKGFKIFCKTKNLKIAEKISKHMFFPNTMVDRITPKYNHENEKIILKKFGYEDKSSIEAESYISWFIEDKINTDFPDLSSVGVNMVSDVKLYQEMKMRMLNASHCSTSFLGILSNLKFVHQTFNNNIFLKFIDKYLTFDVIPHLKKNFYDYKSFKNIILKRFSNRSLEDTVSRTTANGSVNLELFIKPSLMDCFKKGKELKRFSLIYASWYVFLIKKYRLKEIDNLDDENKVYIKKFLNYGNNIENYLNNPKFPNLKNYLNKNFKDKFELYVKLLFDNKLKNALKDATK